MRHAGRQRNVDQRATELQMGLRTAQPEGPAQLAEAFGPASAARVAVVIGLNSQIAEPERGTL